MRQIPLDLGPVSMPGLDEFIVESLAQQQALDWLRGWPASALQARIPAAYFWGASGSGKTHLLRAMVPRALAAGHHVMWVGPHGCQMWDAEWPEAPTLALIDDAERLDGHLQHLAFNLFIESSNPVSEAGGVSIVAAGAVPPVDLPVRDDLRTRLGWGLVFALAPLSEAGVRQALRDEALRRGIKLDDGVVSYLLVRHSRDLAFLTGLLDRLDRFALAEHRTVTVPLLKQMLVLETE